MERAAALRNAVVWQSNASNQVIARALMAEHDGAEQERGCTCLEVYGEDPACPAHGCGSDWAKANPDIADLAEKAAQSDAKDARIAELTAERDAAQIKLAACNEHARIVERERDWAQDVDVRAAEDRAERAESRLFEQTKLLLESREVIGRMLHPLAPISAEAIEENDALAGHASALLAKLYSLHQENKDGK